jgi:hypothetical protein
VDWEVKARDRIDDPWLLLSTTVSRMQSARIHALRCVNITAAESTFMASLGVWGAVERSVDDRISKREFFSTCSVLSRSHKAFFGPLSVD